LPDTFYLCRGGNILKKSHCFIHPARIKRETHNIAVKEHFEQIREQIREIRGFPGPLDIKLETLDYQIKRSRATFELKAAGLKSKVAANSTEIAHHTEQIRQIQAFIK
jgi:hypothetical protein